MGPTPDKFVVNSNLQVHGVDNLRVVDASIIPINVNSNPISAITMIGEKVCKYLKKFNSNSLYILSLL